MANAPGFVDLLASQAGARAAPPASTGMAAAPGFVGSLAATSAQAQPPQVPPDPNELAAAQVSPMVAGVIHGGKELALGADQLWNSTGSIDQWVANHLPAGFLKNYEAKAAAHENANFNSLQQEAAKMEMQWAANPASKTLRGKVGNFLPSLALFSLAPESKAAEGAGLLARFAAPMMGEAATGGMLGAVQPTTPGQSRLGNTVAYAAGAPVMGLGARLGGALLKDAAEVVVPPFARMLGSRAAGKTLLEHAPNLATEPGRAAMLQQAKVLQAAAPGLNPDVAGLTQNPNLASLSRWVNQSPQFQGRAVQNIIENRKAVLAGLGRLGNTSAPATDVAHSVGETLLNTSQAAKAAESKIWNDPQFLSQEMDVSGLIPHLENWKNSLSVSARDNLPPKYMNQAKEIVEKYNGNAPLSEIKDLRSDMLRDAAAKPSAVGRWTNEMANQILNGIKPLADSPGGSALPDYAAATQFTKNLHQNLDPLKTAIRASKNEPSRAAQWLLNMAHPVPERLDAFLKAADTYLPDKAAAPQVMRDFVINSVHRLVNNGPESSPVPSGRFANVISQNWRTIQKLFPDQSRQKLLTDLVQGAKAADYTSLSKVADRGPDTAGKLLGHAWVSESLGHGVHAGNLWGNMAHWVLSLPEKQRASVLFDALNDPAKAALLARKYSPENSQLAYKAFKVGATPIRRFLPAYGATAMGNLVQPRP